MKTFTFKGGIHPAYNKDISIREPVKEALMPDTVIVPLSQHIGAPNQALVKKGDRVEEGQLIGSSDSFVSSPVHAPITGTVKDIKKAFHPSLGTGDAVIIERDLEAAAVEYKALEHEAIDKDDIFDRVKKAGIVGMGGSGLPDSRKAQCP